MVMAELESKWKFKLQDDPSDTGMTESTTSTNQDSFKWTTTDSQLDKKSPIWYIILFLVTVIIAGIIYLLTRDKITTLVILICGLVFGAYGAKKPGTISYQIDDSTLKIGSKQYSLSSFKSYSVMPTKERLVVSMRPIKRFMPYLYIAFNKDEEVKVTPFLSKNLPLENNKGDVIDRFMRYIGF